MAVASASCISMIHCTTVLKNDHTGSAIGLADITFIEGLKPYACWVHTFKGLVSGESCTGCVLVLSWWSQNKVLRRARLVFS